MCQMFLFMIYRKKKFVVFIEKRSKMTQYACVFVVFVGLSTTWFLCSSIALCANDSQEPVPDEQRLVNKLFNQHRYDNSVRPVLNSSENVVITFGLSLIQIMDMDEKNQVLVINAWLKHEWFDDRIVWDPSDYNGLSRIRVPSSKLWLPDIVLYNNADDYTTGFMPINAMIRSNGEIFWSPPARLRSSCKVDITYFPFDIQICEMQFGSWSYPTFQVDMVADAAGVDLTDYTTNGEWMLMGTSVRRTEKVYAIGVEVYSDIRVTFKIQRRILYYILNIIFPCFWLNVLSVLTFCLPPDAGEKITLSITVLLSYSVFMLLVAENMPPTSEFVPLIGIYLTVSMALASVSVIFTVLVLKLHHCAPHQSKVPAWMQKWVLGYLGKIVLCKYSCGSTKKQNSDRSLYPDIPREYCKPRDEPELTANLIKETGKSTQTKKRSSDFDSIRLKDIESNVHVPFNSLDDENGNNDQNLQAMERKQGTISDIALSLQCLLARTDKQDAENDLVDEWKHVAMVVDRALLWLFLSITVISTFCILIIIPLSAYDMSEGL